MHKLSCYAQWNLGRMFSSRTKLAPESEGQYTAYPKVILTESCRTFGVLLGLLNKPRLRFHSPSGVLEPHPSLTSLFLVPHRDLAHQILHWIDKLSNAHQGTRPPLNSIAQVLVRDGGEHRSSALKMLLDNPPPHLLIATPQAAMASLHYTPSSWSSHPINCIGRLPRT